MNPQDRLIARLTNVFGEPKTEDPAAFVAEYAKALAGYDPAILEAAGDEIIKSAVYWPRPAEAVQTARRVAAERGAKQTIGAHVPRQTTAEPVQPRDEDSRARMDAMVRELKAFVAAHSLKPPKQVPLADVSRPAFERMQRSASGLHRALTPRSRAMAGEGE